MSITTEVINRNKKYSIFQLCVIKLNDPEYWSFLKMSGETVREPKEINAISQHFKKKQSCSYYSKSTSTGLILKIFLLNKVLHSSYLSLGQSKEFSHTNITGYRSISKLLNIPVST